MIREIYFRDPTDPRWLPNIIETSSEIEVIINKLRMILMSKRGEVLGEPELGMDLEDMLFDFTFDENKVRQSFYAQIQKYVSEQDSYKIDINLTNGTDGVKNIVYMYITIDNIAYLGYSI